MEVDHLRLPLYPSQPVEVQRLGIVFKGTIEDVLRAAFQGGGRERNVPGDLIPWVASGDRVDSLEPDLGPQFREHFLVVALGAFLCGNLQVALEFAQKVALQNRTGDLGSHDVTLFIGLATAEYPTVGCLSDCS